KKKSFLSRMTTQTVGYSAILSGGFSAAALLDGWNRSRNLLLIVVIVLYGVMIASGILVLMGRAIGAILLALTQVPQLPVIANGNLAWALLPAPAFQLNILPVTGFFYSTRGYWLITWRAQDLPFQVSLSVGSLILFAWAVKQVGGAEKPGPGGKPAAATA